MPVKNFLTIESDYGTFIVNRHCAHQAEVLIKTGKPHVQEELNKVLAIVNTLPEHCVVLDAGANIGLLTIPIAQLIAPKQGVVHAYEAQRMMAYALCGGVVLNDLENVTVHHLAIGAELGTLKAHTPNYSQSQDFGQFSLLEQTQEAPSSVQAVTIDSLNLPRLDFLKIDIEGMEIDALIGARQTLEKHQPWCWVEYWKIGAPEIKAQFAGLDYDFYLMDDLNVLCAPVSKLDKAALNINAKRV